MPWDAGLAGTALEIARSPHNPLRVMAGPGTGKSFAMKRRVARLIENGTPPARILAVTFTRNAAGSLLDDLHNLGVNGCENIACGTLHGFCFRLLGQNDVFAFLERKARPLITFSAAGVLRFEAAPLLKDINGVGDFGGVRECTKRILAFEAAWARLQSDEAGWPIDPIDQQFQAALFGWLKFHEAMLIGELVPEALRYVRGNPTCVALRAYDHVIVDEYQDLNKGEQQLLDLLAANGNQAIVGDVDQSIYSFRHANPEGIADFGITRPGTHDETLDECRRCPKLVVRIAAHLISHNHPPGLPPRLNARAANPDGEVHIIQWDSLSQEADGLARFIKSLVENGHAPADILVLCPRRIIGYKIRDAIATLDVAVHSFYGEEPLEEEKSQKAFALLTLVANPLDRVSLRWLLGHGSPTWRAGQYAILRAYCVSEGRSPHDVLESLHANAILVPGTNQLVSQFASIKQQLAVLTGKSLGEMVDYLFPANEEWANGLREVAIDALTDATNLQELKEHITVGITQREVPEKADFVRVMSLHKSKGLTSKTVVVAGCTEGLIPFIPPDETPSRTADLLKEQRRLFYVAITRGTERLVLSSVRHIAPKDAYKIGAKIRRGGGTVASRFLNELGPAQPHAVAGTDWAGKGYTV